MLWKTDYTEVGAAWTRLSSRSWRKAHRHRLGFGGRASEFGLVVSRAENSGVLPGHLGRRSLVVRVRVGNGSKPNVSQLIYGENLKLPSSLDNHDVLFFVRKSTWEI